MNNVFTIKPLYPADAPALLKFYQTLSPAVVAFYQPFGLEVSEADITNRLLETAAGRNIDFGIFRPDGTIEGHGFIWFIDTVKPVFGIGLQECLHGQGWGRKLMEAVLAAADEKKLRLVTLTVVKVNTKARAMYEKFGFVLKGEETFNERNDSFYMERMPMDELKKALRITVTGPLKEQALAAFEQQMREWNIVMPPAERLVIDFGLGEFYTVGEIECWIANEIEAGYCGKFLFVFDGQTCPLHCHKTKHETFYIVRGKVRMEFDGGVRQMQAGDVLPVPCGKIHSFTGIGPALLLEVSKPCIVDDNYFENTKIPIGGNFKP